MHRSARMLLSCLLSLALIGTCAPPIVAATASGNPSSSALGVKSGASLPKSQSGAAAPPAPTAKNLNNSKGSVAPGLPARLLPTRPPSQTNQNKTTGQASRITALPSSAFSSVHLTRSSASRAFASRHGHSPDAVTPSVYGMSARSCMALTAGQASTSTYVSGSTYQRLGAACAPRFRGLLFPGGTPNALRARSPFGVTVTVPTDGDQIVVSATDGHTIGFAPLPVTVGASVYGSVQNAGSQFTVDGLWPGSKLVGTIVPKGYNETLKLSSWTGQTSWSFLWSAPGLSPTLESDGSIIWSSASGPIFQMPAPVVTNTHGQTGNVSVTLRGDVITMTVAKAWLKAALLRGPVRIDPSVSEIANSQYDGQVLRVNANTLLYLYDSGYAVSVWQSTDNGSSWTAESGSLQATGVDSTEPCSYTVDASENVWVFCWNTVVSGSHAQVVQRWESTNEGATWSNLGTSSTSVTFPDGGYVAYDGGQTVAALVWSDTLSDVYWYQSTDMGGTWSLIGSASFPGACGSNRSYVAYSSASSSWAVACVDSTFLVNSSGLHSLSLTAPGCPSGVFPSDSVAAAGEVIAIAGPACGTAYVPVDVAESTDGGSSWHYITTTVTVPNAADLGDIAVGLASPSGDAIIYTVPSSNPGCGTAQAIENGQLMNHTSIPQGICSQIQGFTIAGVGAQADYPYFDGAFWWNGYTYYEQVSVGPNCAAPTVPGGMITGPFTVNWSCSPPSSGVSVSSSQVSVYEPGGYYAGYVGNGSTTSGTFTPTWGHTYIFYAQAQDSAGDWGPVSPPSTVTYDPPTGLRSLWTYKTWDLGAAGTVRINVASGDLLYSLTESRVPTVAGSVDVTLNYNSLLANVCADPLGCSWTSPLIEGVSALDSSSGSLIGEMFRDGTGAYFPYYANGQGGYISPAGDHRTLTATSSGFSLTDLLGNTLDFNSSGALSAYVDRNDNTLTYTDSSSTGGYLSNVTDPSSGTSLTMGWNGSGYSGGTDMAGVPFAINWDSTGDITSVVRNSGNSPSQTVTLGYDGAHHITTITDPNGNEWEISYNSAGQVTEFGLLQNGSLVDVTSFSYGSGQTTVTNPLGDATTYDYGANGAVTAVTDPLGYRTTYTISNDGTVLTVTDPNNHTTEYTYDTTGNLTQTTDALGNATTNSYPTSCASGTYCLAQVVETSYPSTNNSGNVYTTYTYDAQGDILSKTRNPGITTRYAYNAQGERLTKTDPGGNQWTYTYTPNGQVATVTDPAGHVTTYTYTSAGLVASVKDANGNTTTYSYDALGNLLSETNALNQTTSYAYNADGEKTSMTDANGNTWTYAYNAAGQLVSTTDPYGKTTTYTYNTDGQKTGMTNADGQTTTYAYDAAGRLTSVTNSLGDTTSYGYDAAGNQTSVTNPLGYTTTTTYNPDNEKASVATPSGGTTTYSYDPRGLLISETGPDGHTTTYTYNTLGEKVSMTDARGVESYYSYGPRGHLTSIKNGDGKVTDYSYNNVGELASVTDALGNVTTNSYDPVGNLTTVTLPGGTLTDTYQYNAVNEMTKYTNTGGASWTYAYDAVGNPTGVTDPNGVTTTNTYDKDNRLVQVSYSNGNPTVTYTYDAAGYQTGMTDGTGTTTYSYNSAGELTSVAEPTVGTVQYGYDAAGNRTSLTYPGGTDAASLTYNSDGELTGAGYTGQTAAQYSYNANGTLASETLPNGVTITYTYDANDWVKSITVKAATSGSSFTWTYSHDNVGNITGVAYTGCGCTGFGNSANTTSSYGYNNDNELTSATYSNGTTQSWAYNALGERTSQTTSGTQVNYSYNNAMEMTAAGSNTYTYNADGQRTGAMIGGSAVTYSYNAAGQMTGYSGPSSSASYVYNGAGMRASKTVNGTTTNYVLDETGSVPRILEGISGGSTTTYLYGAGLVGTESPAGAWTYPIMDAMGNPRYVTDSTGNATTESYLYDAFGNVLSSSGTTSATFQFKNEQVDGVSGLQPMGARMYDPTAGVFLSPDPLTVGLPAAGYMLNPGSLYPYAFAGNNPITGADPTGLFSIGNPLGSGWIQVTAKDAGQIHNWLSSEWFNKAHDPQLQTVLHNDAALIEARYGAAAGPVGGLTEAQLEVSGALMVTSTNPSPGVGGAMKVRNLSPWAYTPTPLGWWATGAIGAVVVGGAVAACAVGGCAAVAASAAGLVGTGAGALSTPADQAVFWSGIGDANASDWVAANGGGVTLESTLEERGISMPALDRSIPSSVQAWRQVSAQFASGAQGNVRVLYGAAVRISSIWAEIEYPTLIANQNVTSITAISVDTGEETMLWTRP